MAGIARKLGALGCAACLALFCAGTRNALAADGIYTFSADRVPAELLATAMQVSTGDVTITLTFAGDCTLGGEARQAGWPKSFASLADLHGMDYPFRYLLPLFDGDDLTVVNLEGVLSDRELEKTPKKKYNFIGRAGYAAALTRGSVECVNLANNHILDYGAEGRGDTVAALEAEGVGYFDDSTVTVLEKDGVRVGLTGSLFGLGEGQKAALAKQLKALREVGCQWIVHTMHAGVEYAKRPSTQQRSVAKYLAEQGVALVVGHHPHVVQGMEMMGNVPVLYSLGNCSFGGNARPKDYDACLLRAEIRFSGGELESMRLRVFPIRVSGERRINNFQPVLLTGSEAERVVERLRQSSTVELAPYGEGEGASPPLIRYGNLETGEGTDEKPD